MLLPALFAVACSNPSGQKNGETKSGLVFKREEKITNDNFTGNVWEISNARQHELQRRGQRNI